MMNLTALQLALFIVMIYICIYSIVNRICKCFEHCSTAKSYGTVAINKPEILELMINEQNRKNGKNNTAGEKIES